LCRIDLFFYLNTGQHSTLEYSNLDPAEQDIFYFQVKLPECSVRFMRSTHKDQDHV
jgi:hypothetical protein